MNCGLLGRKLGHSYSPQIHAHLGSYRYALFEKEPEELEAFLKNGDFTGLNVTIPYKKDVIPYLDELSPAAERLGAVNTIVRRPDGRLVGHNTDYFGFRWLVKKSGLAVAGKKVLVLGSGGASNTAVAVLWELGADVVVISRSGENNYENLDRHADAAVIVNTTPVGMYPNTGKSPLSLAHFPALEGVLDVVYNPARTQILLDASARGLITENGLWMLVAQAKESAEWFTGRKIEDEVIARIHRALRRQMENIILIGMPGCGKSTLGQAVAAALQREFVDCDAEIVRRAGKSIPEIFAQDGEGAFRALESGVLTDVCRGHGLVISTGGGAVLRAENRDAMRQNGRVCLIRRALALLPRDGRPLSASEDAGARLWEARRAAYETAADFPVENDGTVEAAAEKIREGFYEAAHH